MAAVVLVVVLVVALVVVLVVAAAALLVLRPLGVFGHATLLFLVLAALRFVLLPLLILLSLLILGATASRFIVAAPPRLV